LLCARSFASLRVQVMGVYAIHGATIMTNFHDFASKFKTVDLPQPKPPVRINRRLIIWNGE